jgi:threonine aldolase
VIPVPPNDAVVRTLVLKTPLRNRPLPRLERLRRYLEQDSAARDGADLVGLLQRRVAEVLGKEAALLLPTGKMAQQIALRLHSERSGRLAFAAHPTTHLVHWEAGGYSAVHGLRFHAVGDPNRLFGEDDLRVVRERLAAVVWELPQREIGGQLPDWGALVAQVSAAREMGAVPHLDGARLWEAQTFYDRPHAEIAGLFDTVYVSLYKSLEAPRGAVLAGSRDFIGEARTWAVRLGGESAGNWPLAAFGLQGLAEGLPEMAERRRRALKLGEAINGSGVARTVPDPPLTPLFHVHLPVSAEAAIQAQDHLIEETGIQLFSTARTSPDRDRCVFEVTVGRAAMEIAPEEVADLLIRLVERARKDSADLEARR